MRLAPLLIAFSIASVVNGAAVAKKGNEMLSLPGQTFRAIELVVKELDRHSLNVENYQITVEANATSIFVTFDDATRAPGQRGSSPRSPGFEVEISGATLAIVRSNFAK